MIKKLIPSLLLGLMALPAAADTYHYRQYAKGLVAPPVPVGQVQLSSDMLTFGTRDVGYTTNPQTVTLTNIGNAPLTVSNIRLGAGAENFTLSNTCTAPLAPNTGCDLTAAFAPKSSGPLEGEIVITSNAKEPTATVGLSGTGGASLTVSSVSPNSGKLGAGTVFAVNGNNFDGTTVVKVNGVTATCGTPTLTQIPGCVAPAQASAGTYAVTVSKDSGSTNSSQTFTYLPPGPSGTLVKILNGQVTDIALDNQGTLLYLQSQTVKSLSPTGTQLATLFTGSSGANFGIPGGCYSAYTPALKALSVDPSDGKIVLGGACSDVSRYNRASIWKVNASNSASNIGGSYGADSNSNEVIGVTVGGGMVYASYSSTVGTNTLQGKVSLSSNGFSTLPSRSWAASMAYRSEDGLPYMVATNGILAKFVSGGSWTQVGTAALGNAAGAKTAAGRDGFIYYAASTPATLYKINPTTGAVDTSWNLTGITGALSGLQVTSTGMPFIATTQGIWRMD
jgi:hypothetical protein